MPLVICATLSTIACFVGGCGGSPSVDASRFPPRQPGCEITTYPEAPTVQTENIGTVQSTCDTSISDEDCTRTLKDEACKLGGDVIWGIEGPMPAAGKKRFSGRAAHTKATGK